MLAVVSLMSFSIYIYAIHAIARNIVVRQGLEKQIAEVSTKLDLLEYSYIELKNDVTIELAYLHGFQEVKDPLYVSRSRNTSLSFNTLR